MDPFENNSVEEVRERDYSTFVPDADYEATEVIHSTVRDRDYEVGLNRRFGRRVVVISHLLHKKNGKTRRGHFIHLIPLLFPALAEFIDVATLVWNDKSGGQTYVGTAFSGDIDDLNLFDNRCVRVFVFKSTSFIIRLKGSAEEDFCIDDSDTALVLDAIGKAFVRLKLDAENAAGQMV